MFTTESFPKSKIGVLLWHGFHPPLRSPNGKPEVCEYRSGRLIRGRNEKEVFVPKVGSKIIVFSGYRYTSDGRGIYNLPGYFRPMSAGAAVDDAPK